MRIIAIGLAILFLRPNLGFSQITFLPSLETAREVAQAFGKDILLLIHNENSKTTKKVIRDLESPGISRIINHNFVCAKIGSRRITIDFKERYDLKTAPTLLFLDRQGYEMGRNVGYKDRKTTSAFIKSFTRQLNGLEGLRREYRHEKTDNPVLVNYYDRLIRYGFDDEANRLVDQYFANLSAQKSVPDFSFIFHSPRHFRLQSFRYVLENLNVFDTLYSYENVNAQLCNAVVENLSPQRRNDEHISTSMKTIFAGYDYDRFWNHYAIKNYEVRRDVESQGKFTDLAMSVISGSDCEHADWYNEVVFSVMLKNKDDEFLKGMIPYMENCIEHSGSLDSMDILAAIQYRLGHKEDAANLVNKARQIALDQGMAFKSSMHYFQDLGFFD